MTAAAGRAPAARRPAGHQTGPSSGPGPGSGAGPGAGEAEPGCGQSLFAGGAGLVMAQAEYARTGAGSWDDVRRAVAAMVADPVTADPDSTGLHRGVPAVAFALHSTGRPGHATALATLDEYVATVTARRLRTAHQRIDCGGLPRLREYDLIRGLTGIGAHLLRRDPGGAPVRDVLAYLVRLTAPLHIDGQVLPGWWSGDAPDGRPSARWPGGHANLGLAHGIAGPLALLATAARRGVTVAGHLEAVERVCRWLDGHRSGPGPGWPEVLPRTGSGETRAAAGPSRPSWCYGTPGLARAQQLAGLALEDPDRQRRSERALLGCLTDRRQRALLIDASVCHGWAGVLLCTWRAAAAPGSDPRLAEHVPRLRSQLQAFLDQGHPAGYGPPARPGGPLEGGLLEGGLLEGGLLEGELGVRLVQHTTTAAPGSGPAWDDCLLVAG